MNLNTGDIFHDKKWREYFDADANDRQLATLRQTNRKQYEKRVKKDKFVVGSVVGMMVDMDRGIINFYKDGRDLGQAFCMPQLKKGPFFPFLQIQEVCGLSVFHPSVYPLLKNP
mmetsp:Transcript_4400/g.6396  ORF Transcript_4400/g.6396 Transcript_4400/m.6396 type:complete len:114 (-) Transcript_4400:17-358(-)